MIANLRQDLRYAVRALWRAPTFSLTVLVTLALGIGANVAVFSVVNGVLRSPLPFADADRVIQLADGATAATYSEPEVADIRRDGQFFSDVGTYVRTLANVTGGTDAERVLVARVDPGFFGVLRPTFLLGRAFRPDEDVAGGPDVVVISYGLWQRRFAMDSAAIGSRIIIDGVPRTVVGIAPAHFDYPSPAVAVWTPLRLDRAAMVTRNNHYLGVIARLAPGTTIGSAGAQMRAMRDQWTRAYPAIYRAASPLHVEVRPIRDGVVGAVRPYIIALFGAVGFVLLIACVNVANLLLVRGEGRRREITLRSVLGATRGRLTIQLALESALVTVVGGALGVAVAWPALRILVAVAPDAVPRTEAIRLDGTVLAFAAGVCLLVGAAFALAPLVQALRTDMAEALNAGARGATHGGGRAARRVRAALVVSEVALAVVMLAGATSFLRTLTGLHRTDLGFATGDVLTASVSLPQGAYTGERAAAFTADLVARVRRLPGVSRAAAMAWTPIASGGGNWSVAPEGATTNVISDLPTAEPQQVTPGFFETLRIPLRAGRAFTDADRRSSEPVVIVNETLARKLWGSTDVLGRRLRMPAGSWPYMRVVGVVGDTRVDGITEAPPGVMYFPHDQAGATAYFTSLIMTLAVQVEPGAAAPLPAIRGVVKDLDPNVPLAEARTMADVVASSIARQRFTTALLSGLAALAIVLAMIGIYGVAAYGVAQRRVEIGIRMALGSGASRVIALVLREGLVVAVLGLALGTGGAVMLGQLLRSLLASVHPVDVATMGVVSLILVVVALVAVAVPARRAAGVLPTEALRDS